MLRVRLQPLLLIVPRMHSSSRSLAHIALFAALIAVLGLIPKINRPLGVPVTAQTLGIMLAGCLLGPVRGFLAVLLFLGGVAMDCRCSLAEGAASACSWRPLPVSLIGFPFGAACAGAVMRWLPGPVLLRAFAASAVGGIGVVYLFGIPLLAIMAHLTLWQATLGSLVFVVGDLIKCVLATIIVRTVARGRPELRISHG